MSEYNCEKLSKLAEVEPYILINRQSAHCFDLKWENDLNCFGFCPAFYSPQNFVTATEARSAIVVLELVSRTDSGESGRICNIFPVVDSRPMSASKEVIACELRHTMPNSRRIIDVHGVVLFPCIYTVQRNKLARMRL